MRKPILAAAAVIAVAIAIAGIAARSMVRETADTLRERIAKKLGVDVAYREVGLDLLPRPAFDVQGVAVSPGARGRARQIATAEHVRVVPRVLPLLLGEADVSEIVVEGADFVLRDDEHASATGLLGLLAEASVPVSLRDARVRAFDAAGQSAWLDVVNLDARILPADADGKIAFSATGSPLGESSHAELSGSWQPGAGRGGGDHLEVEMHLRDGDPTLLAGAFPRLRKVDLVAPLEVTASAAGFIGERSTESAPARALEGEIEASVGLDLFGVAKPLALANAFAVDDKRYVLRNGKGSWGDLPFTSSGWYARAGGNGKLAARVETEKLEVGPLLAEYGVPERWRPRATASGGVRVFGSQAEPLARWQASAPSLRFDGWEGLPLVAGESSVQGALLASNADVSGSLKMRDVRVGSAEVAEMLMGVVYWRDKVTATSIGLPLWGGTIDAGVSYFPKEEGRKEGGAVLRALDVGEVLAQVAPDLALDLTGRVNAVLQLGVTEAAPWLIGRANVTRGTIGPRGLVREVVEDIGAGAGVSGAGVRVETADPAVLDAARLPFESMAFDFQARDGERAVRVDEIVCDGVVIKGEGKVGSSGSVDGWATLSFAPALATDVAKAVPAVRALATRDGALHVPVHVGGTVKAATVDLDAAFDRALAHAVGGTAVGPFTPDEPAWTLQLDLPPLEDTFGG